MGRRKNKKRPKKQKIFPIVQVSNPKKQRDWWETSKWNVFCALLAILTGLILPFYFQYQTDQSQKTVANIPSTVQTSQSTVIAKLTPSNILPTTIPPRKFSTVEMTVESFCFDLEAVHQDAYDMMSIEYRRHISERAFERGLFFIGACVHDFPMIVNNVLTVIFHSDEADYTATIISDPESKGDLKFDTLIMNSFNGPLFNG